MSKADANAEKRTGTKAYVTGPSPEPSPWGGYTGHYYYECQACGAEWLKGEREAHRPGCPHRGGRR